jgi:hypothetical protein
MPQHVVKDLLGLAERRAGQLTKLLDGLDLLAGQDELTDRRRKVGARARVADAGSF